MSVRGKHILVGVCGGIAAFKTATLVRLLRKAGAEVKVVMTPAAKEFITPLTLATLSGHEVISEFFTANTGRWHSHVSLGLWSDCMVIAPATASTIAKMANGVADNMLVTTYLSMKAPVFLAPAMDLDMMVHPSTMRNLAMLREYGNSIIEPESGELASGLIGKGRMAEPETIFDVVNRHYEKKETLKSKKILITSGPTHEKIDPVRYIGNYSSGKMGCALAEECAARGAEVIFVSGPGAVIPVHPSIEVIRVTGAMEMLDVAIHRFPECDAAIMAAAVADYRPVECAASKIKREKNSELVLQLVANPDIAATLGACRKPTQTLIGFALETDNGEENACGKLKRKGLDWIVLNSMNDPQAGFGVDTNKVTIYGIEGSVHPFPVKSKRAVAADIVSLCLEETK